MGILSHLTTLALTATLSFTASNAAHVGLCPVANPSPTLCILSADDAGTAAALAAAWLNVSAVLTTWNVRDVGGDLTSAARTDLFTSARNVGGLSYVYDRFARRSYNAACGQEGTARIAPPGPSFLYLHAMLQSLAPTVQLLSGWMPLPGGGLLDAAGRVAGVTMVDATGDTCTLRCRYAVEGSGEGYALRAFNVSVRFGREGYRNDSSTDETNRGESLAGRRMFGACSPKHVQHCNATDFAMGLAPPWYNVSDTSEELEDVSMAASALLGLRQYAPDGATVPSDAPWLITSPPTGYSNGSYWFLDGNKDPPQDGSMGNNVYRCLFEHSYGLPRWYELPAGSGQHYLRTPGSPWAPKQQVEMRSLAYAVGALYYMQQRGSRGWGLDNESYPLPAYPACFNLSQLGTSAYGGGSYEQISCRLYKRNNARLNSSTPVGGQAMLPRPLFMPPVESIFRTYWEPASLGVPLYPVDYRGVLSDTVPMPDYAGPEGLVSLAYGGLAGTDVHGLHRRILEPDASADGGAPVLNLLSPGAPRTTFQAQAAVRIHATSSNLGLAAVALVAATEALRLSSTAATPTALAQWLMASAVGGVVSFSDAGMSRLPSFAISQLPGAYGVPPGQVGSSWAPSLPSHANATLWLSMYSSGLLNGVIPRWPPAPAIPPPPPLPHNVTLPFPPDDDLFTRGDLAASLDAILPGSAAAVLGAPVADPSAPALLRDWRAAVTRHILLAQGVLGATPASTLAPYSFPTYWLVESYNRPSSDSLPLSPEWPPHNSSSNASNAVCTADAGLTISGGVLVRQDNADTTPQRAHLCSVPAIAAAAADAAAATFAPAYRLSVEAVLEQVPSSGGAPTIINAGLYFEFASNATTQHGFFGLLSDAGAGNDATAPALQWGLRLPYSGGTLLTTAVPWPDFQVASFYLEVTHDGAGTYTGYVNGQQVLSGSSTQAPPPVIPPRFGVRSGEGPGRVLYSNLVLTAGTASHRGDI